MMFEEFVKHDVYWNKTAWLVGLRVKTLTYQLGLGLEDDDQVTDLSSIPGSLIEGTTFIGGLMITRTYFLHTGLMIILFQLSILVQLNCPVGMRLGEFGDSAEFISFKIKLGFHLSIVWRGSELVGGGGPLGLPLHDDVGDLLLVFVTVVHVEKGGEGCDRHRGFAFGFDDAGDMVFVYQRCERKLLLDESRAEDFELKARDRNREGYFKKYLSVSRCLVLVPVHVSPPTFFLDVGGGVSEGVEDAVVVIRAEPKEECDKGIETLDKTVIPDEDRGPWVATDPLAGHNLIGGHLDLEHPQGQVFDDFEGGLSDFFVTGGDSFSRDDQTSLYVLTMDSFYFFFNKLLQRPLIFGQLSLASLQQCLASLESSKARFCGHRDSARVLWFFGDRGIWKRSVQRNVLGVARGMGSADETCFDYNLVFVIDVCTVQVYWLEEGTSNWAGFKEDLVIIYFISRY